MKHGNGTAGRVGSVHTKASPEPMWVSRLTRTVLVLGGVPIVLLGGSALALAISFPVLRVLFDFFRARLRTKR